jgi:DNA polymerase-3 subunit alpha
LPGRERAAGHHARRHGDLAKAEEEFKWWLDLFGEDYYVELQRHGIPEQDQVNARCWCNGRASTTCPSSPATTAITPIREDSNAHDILLCINTGEKQSTPKAEDGDDGGLQKGKRFAFYNDEFFFKTQAQMAQTFHDLPEAWTTRT